MNIEQQFKRFAALRYAKLSPKYLDENGNNKGLTERNNIIDILEELADAYNIMSLLISRIDKNVKSESVKDYTITIIQEIQEQISMIVQRTCHLNYEIENIFDKDVERVVKWEGV